MKTLLSVTEAAEILGVSTSRVRQFIRLPKENPRLKADICLMMDQ